MDLRYALRTLAGQPSFTAVALVALLLGIGLNTSAFTAINALATRTWDVPDADRVIQAYGANPRLFPGLSDFPVAAARFLNEQSRAVEGVAAGRVARVQLEGADTTVDVDAELVTGNYFEVLRVGMEVGRAFRAEEDVAGSPIAVAVLGHFTWKQRFGADPTVVGRTIRLDGVPFTVIGVVNESFGGTSEDRTEVWAPLAALPLVMPTESDLLTDPTRCCVGLLARLRDGVTRAQAQAEWNALYRQYSSELNGPEIDVLLAGTAMLDHPQRRAQVAPVLAIVSAAFGSVLLLACANVSNLLLARATTRRAEIAVRAAIGAGRWRVVRQLLTESAVLALGAAVLALPLAFVLPNLLLRLMGQTLPTNLHLTPDANVVFFAIASAALSAAAFGLAPALRSTRSGLMEAMKQHSAQMSPRSALRGVLLGVQVAISVALLMAAGLLVRGLNHAHSLDLGFRTDGMAALQVKLPIDYDPTREAAFFDELTARLGVGVGVSHLVPLGERREFVGADCSPRLPLLTQWVTPGYFNALEIPVIAGRNLVAEDAARGSIVVNEALARYCWPDGSPVGRTEAIGGRPREIVGVVRDAQVYGIGPVPPIVFSPFVPDGNVLRGGATVVLPIGMTAAGVAAVRDLEGRATVDALTLQEQVDRSLGDTAGIARMAGALGLFALVLAAVGVYGVISYSVEQQRREIGVRIALGARPGQVVSLVLRRNARALAVGLAVGLAIAVGESIVMASELYGLSPLDPLAYIGVLALLVAAGVAATVIPARRAAHTDPTVVLRHE
jgi:predicted permease